MTNDVVYNGFRYTDENAYFLPNGEIVPRVCPYCKCEVKQPETYRDYLVNHEDCFGD